jgi:Sulfotransferase family
MLHSETPMKVLYIMGTGRSGSTILDIVLGNHPNVESTGELSNLMFNGWVGGESLRGIDRKMLRVPICTCGRRTDIPEVEDAAEACPFWSSVRCEWVGRVDPRDDIESYPALQEAFDRFRRLPRLLREGRRPSPRFRSYARLTRALYESISAVSGKPVIVDSTKAPVRALALSMVPGIDVRLVHNVRDVRGVMSSRTKVLRKNIQAGIMWDHEGHPAWTSAARWVHINLVSEWICSQLGPGRAVRVRHEDLYVDTWGVLGKIAPLIGVDLTGVVDAASSGKSLHVGHNIGGNRTKKSEIVTLRPDTQEWRSALSAREQRLTWALVGWLMRRYGYKR